VQTVRCLCVQRTSDAVRETMLKNRAMLRTTLILRARDVGERSSPTSPVTRYK
jgi:hypothetical protein